MNGNVCSAFALHISLVVGVPSKADDKKVPRSRLWLCKVVLIFLSAMADMKAVSKHWQERDDPRDDTKAIKVSMPVAWRREELGESL